MSRRVGPEDPPDEDNSGPLFSPRPPPPKPGEVVYRFPNGSTMHLKGLDEPARLFASNPPPVLGDTFDESVDGARLGAQFLRVQAVMADGQWRTLRELSVLTGDPEASASARIRDLRRAGWSVERRRRGPAAGTHEYRATRGNPG